MLPLRKIPLPGSESVGNFLPGARRCGVCGSAAEFEPAVEGQAAGLPFQLVPHRWRSEVTQGWSEMCLGDMQNYVMRSFSNLRPEYPPEVIKKAPNFVDCDSAFLRQADDPQVIQTSPINGMPDLAENVSSDVSAEVAESDGNNMPTSQNESDDNSEYSSLPSDSEEPSLRRSERSKKPVVKMNL